MNGTKSLPRPQSAAISPVCHTPASPDLCQRLAVFRRVPFVLWRWWLSLMAVAVTGGTYVFPPAAFAAASQITSITPSCAAAGDTVVIEGNGFGATNVTITVGGVVAQVVAATGRRVTFIVPPAVPPGLTPVTATNPGGHTGSIPLRVKGPEICGNQSDEDCDGHLDDPDACQAANAPPVADAGPDQHVLTGQTVQLDGSRSRDADGDPLTYRWSLAMRPPQSAALLTNADTANPTFVADVAGTYEVQLVVDDGQGGSATAATTVTATAPPLPPSLQVEAQPRSGFAPLRVTFTAVTSAPYDDGSAYVWDFGDGTGTTGAAAQTHSYHAAGTYTVTVTSEQTGSRARVDITVNATPDPHTTAVGRGIDRLGQPVAGARVHCLGVAGLSGADGIFTVPGVPTTRGEVQCVATYVTARGKVLSGLSAEVPPVAGGVTDVGAIVLQEPTSVRYPGLRFPVGDAPRALVVADLNADGVLDLAVVNQASSDISVLLGRGEGRVQEVQRLTLNSSPSGVVAADLSGDGVLDLVVTSGVPYTDANNVFILLGKGDGTFQSLPGFPFLPHPHTAVTADFNGDGKLDLALARTSCSGTGTAPSRPSRRPMYLQTCTSRLSP